MNSSPPVPNTPKMSGSGHTATASSSSTHHSNNTTTSPTTYHYSFDDDDDDSINNETTRVQVVAVEEEGEYLYLPVDPTPVVLVVEEEVDHEGEEEIGEVGDWAADNGTCCCCNFTSYDANATTNATATILTTNSTRGPGDSYYFYETEQFTVLWILFISIVVGNVAVLAALLLSKARKSRTNFFIMHLALADLSVGLISVLTDIVWKSTVSWHAGNAGCKAVRFAQVLVTYSSTYVLVALSIDRYDAITHPMNFSGSWRRARRLVMVAWLLSAVFASPCLLFFMEASVDGVVQCWIDFPEAWQWKLYMTVVALTIFLFPTLIITACYAIIVYTIWSKSKMMTVGAHALGAPNGERRACVGEEDSRRASSRGLIPKAKIKTVKMTLVIVLVFVLCWSPYIVFDLLQVYGFVPQSPTNVAVATLIQSLAPLNSAANPVIYCIFSSPICRNIRQKWSTTKSTFTISSKNPSAGLGGGGGGGGGGVARVQTVAARVEQEQQPPPPPPPPKPPSSSSSSSSSSSRYRVFNLL